MDILAAFQALLFDLRREKREKYQRHVSVGDLLTDRWEIAREHGFGAGTSCYDNVLILGSVTVGKHCWIGPNVVLDGIWGGLSIGDYVDICAGAQIYKPSPYDAPSTIWRGRSDRLCADPDRLTCLHRPTNGDLKKVWSSVIMWPSAHFRSSMQTLQREQRCARAAKPQSR